MELRIRPLCEADIEPLSAIEAEAFSMPWSPRDFAELLKHDYCLYLVAEADGVVAGCAGMTVSCGEGSIDNVVVAQKYRGRGIAKRMLEALFERGAAQGVGAYTLEVRVGNREAIHLYEKVGFVSEGVRPRFYEKPTEDALIMWKRDA
ncbi:MAG: ribosomal protein S18-alanine N-acetyltransferase [Candidatus Gastranaerophilales bacterium]|nr:ribosomal protein S18-alanine N-acetyltransferase [Candidatus Gastranaerophilales bacterium]